jgi:hypothetical protein
LTKVLILSDIHAGAVCGLCPPEYYRKDLEEIQSKFWNWYYDKLSLYGPFDFVMGIGDFTDGEGKKGTLGTFITDVRKQAEIASCILKKTGVPGKNIFLVRGTPFHGNGPCEYEDHIADETGCSIKDTQKVEIEGWKIHNRHVVGRSDIPYGQATPLLKELVRCETEAFRENKEAPDIIIRGHVHYEFELKRDGRMALDCPCLELPLDSANGRRYQAWYYTVGFNVLTLDHDKAPYNQCVDMPMRIIKDDHYIKVSKEGEE